MDPRRVLITGGAGGLGAAIARTVVGRGGAVVVADRDAAAAIDLLSELRETGGAAEFVEADLSEETSVRRLFRQISDAQPLDLLVNNAGGWWPGPQFPEGSDWLRSLDLNLRMPMLATQLAMPLLSGGGAVVNVASSAGAASGAYGSPEYGAAKAGLIRFTTAVADFADRYGVRVSCVIPHWIGLPRAVAEYRRLGHDEQMASGGLVDPQLIADAVCDLAADPDSAGRVLMIRPGRPPYAFDPALDRDP